MHLVPTYHALVNQVARQVPWDSGVTLATLSYLVRPRLMGAKRRANALLKFLFGPLTHHLVMPSATAKE